MSEIEESIARSGLSGDAEARRQVEDHFKGRLQNFVRRRGYSDEAQIDALLNKIWSYVWERAASFARDPRLRFGAWLDMQAQAYFHQQSAQASGAFERTTNTRRPPSSSELESIDVLVMRAQGGEADAIKQLAEHCTERVWRSLGWRGVPKTDWDDVAQDVVVNAILNLQKFTVGEGSSFRAWFAAIARNVTIDYFRRRSREARKSLRADDGQDGNHGAGQDGEGGKRASNAAAEDMPLAAIALYEALAGMPDDQRHIFIAYHHDRVTVPELAQSMAMKPSRVYELLRSARDSVELALNSAPGRAPDVESKSKGKGKPSKR